MSRLNLSRFILYFQSYNLIHTYILIRFTQTLNIRGLINLLHVISVFNGNYSTLSFSCCYQVLQVFNIIPDIYSRIGT